MSILTPENSMTDAEGQYHADMQSQAEYEESMQAEAEYHEYNDAMLSENQIIEILKPYHEVIGLKAFIPYAKQAVDLITYKTCIEILDRLGLLNLKGVMLTEDGKLVKDTIQAIINETGIKC